jgi:hypothetical protein
MSLNHSPKIVTDGLVFAYDMNNTKKSWKGAPTSNLIYTTPLTIGLYAYCTGPVATTVLDPIGNPTTANRYTITANSLVPRAAVATNVTVGATYSFSALIRYNGNSPTPSFYVNATKGIPEASGSNTIINETSSFTPVGGNWYMIKWTFTVSASPTGKSLVLWGVTSSASDIGNTFDVYNEHFEQLSYVTPFVKGVRSNTQALLDLTGNITITAPSLTYATDGTFSFNGTSDYIDLGLNSVTLGLKQVATYSCWIKPTTANAMYGISDYGINGLGMTLRTNNNTSADFYVYPNNHRITYTYNFNPNIWYNLVGVMDNLNMYMYLNGVLVGTTTLGEDIGNSSGTLRIGSRGDSAVYGTGYASNVTIYKRALTAAQINQNFNASRGIYGV